MAEANIPPKVNKLAKRTVELLFMLVFCTTESVLISIVLMNDEIKYPIINAIKVVKPTLAYKNVPIIVPKTSNKY